MTDAQHKLLFLCTGNYYRSRFAEELFNSIAGERALWRAGSCGLRLSSGNVGPISEYAVQELQRLGICVADSSQTPRTVTEEYLQTATRIIAVKEVEHRPLLEQDFPALLHRVEFWQIDDIDCSPPEVALPRLAVQVRRLATELLTPPQRDITAAPK